jgi:hypothetical protein
MIQIGTVILAPIATPSNESWEKIIRETNENRLKAMQAFGHSITIDELTEEKWRNFYINEYNQKKYEEILIRRGEA